MVLTGTTPAVDTAIPLEYHSMYSFACLVVEFMLDWVAVEDSSPRGRP